MQLTVSHTLPTIVDAAIASLNATPAELSRFRVDPHALQAEMLKLPQIDLEDATQHQFIGGMYVRTLTCQPGEMYVGRQHKRASVFMLLSGEGVFFSPLGSQRLKGPQIFMSPAGDKKAGICETQAVIVNISNVSELGDCTDLEVVERYLFEDDPTSPYTTGNRLK